MTVMTPDKEEYQECDVCGKELEDPDDIEHGRHLKCEAYTQ